MSPEEELIRKIVEFDKTTDHNRRKELANEIANISSDPDLIREMEEYLRFDKVFKLTP